MARQKAAGGEQSPPADAPPVAATPASAPEPAAATPAAAPPKPAAKPAAAGSTADILAKIRGQGASAPAAASPASAPVAKPPSVPVPAAALPPVEAMLQQLKAGTKTAAELPRPALKLPEKPAGLPVKPAPKSPAAATSRRNVLLGLIASPFALAWTLFAGLTGTWTLMLARFMFPNVLVEPPSRFKIGVPSDYSLGTVSTKWTAARGIWVVHTDQYKGRDLIYALASVCTHLGCTPSWLEGEQKFKCPCHGSGFYINGVNFEGPAPRPLERVGLRLASDGMLEVDKSVKFQEEKGQWEDSKSYVDASLL